MANVLLSDGIWPWEQPSEPSKEEKAVLEALRDNYDTVSDGVAVNSAAEQVSEVLNRPVSVSDLLELAKKYNLKIKMPRKSIPLTAEDLACRPDGSRRFQ